MNDEPKFHLHSCIKLAKSLESFCRKGQKSQKASFWKLNPNNPRLRFFLKNDWPYCPLHSCKKLGKSLEPFWKKGEES